MDAAKLEQLLTSPSERLLADVRKINEDVMILGAAGKMGPSLAVLLKNAFQINGQDNNIICVSRFSDKNIERYLQSHELKTIAGDLLNSDFLDALPDVPNLIYMAGQKFGTTGKEPGTWAMNVFLPGLVARKYRNSRIVVFSTGNVYPLVPVKSAGANEETSPEPIGEYAQSCLGRERMFQFYSQENKTPVLIFRLNYALDLRYGVLTDIAQKIWQSKPINLTMGHVNVIWQGDANEFAIRSLLRCSYPAEILNVTGGKVLEVKELAFQIGNYLGKSPTFAGKPADTALLSNSGRALQIFGKPRVSIAQMCNWTATWIKSGGTQLNKPTHFQTRDGKF